jgi:hypothetical protein
MKATIKKVVYDTETATEIGYAYAGEFGQPSGYEERLFITGDNKHFVYGVGGSESPYHHPTIKPLTNPQAAEWKKANNI